jgi:hypothetical protein
MNQALAAWRSGHHIASGTEDTGSNPSKVQGFMENICNSVLYY